MKQPQKWRETIDPFSLTYKKFQLQEVLGYPHAGNDVFYAKGFFEGKEETVFIKCERQKGANVANEVNIINQLHFSHTPKIVEYSLTDPKFVITKEAQGERLSTILANNPKENVFDYLPEYGKTLAQLHCQKPNCLPVEHRKFFAPPPDEYFSQHNLHEAKKFLLSNTPKYSQCFVHGDFHYANILWNNFLITAVLDYELSGFGIREYDMAWAVFLRPSQKFLYTAAERKAFLDGYSQHQSFNKFAFNYFLVQIACHFYSMGDDKYKDDVRQIILQTINE